MPITPPEPVVPRDQAASFGGPGWRVRSASHAEDLLEGRLWSPYRVASEVGRLEAVLLAWPGPELDVGDDPDAHLMIGRVNVARIQRQARDIADYYRSHGVRVHTHRPARRPPPNYVFMRDLFMMTPEGAVLGRPAGLQRAGEERWAAEALALAGVPILRTLRGGATFEGADALWISPQLVLLGTGVRTNHEAAQQLEDLLSELGVRLERVPLPRTGVQHLLGVVNLIDSDLAAINGAKADTRLLDRLGDLGVQPIVIPPGEELLDRRSNNFVTMAPRWVVMPSDCTATRDQLEAHGVRCDELDVSEYVKAAGALGCLTGILSRA
jgi:N-dimethylarginine dimethylaminohydrolase